MKLLASFRDETAGTRGIAAEQALSGEEAPDSDVVHAQSKLVPSPAVGFSGRGPWMGCNGIEESCFSLFGKISFGGALEGS